jgi:hypothetical protein
MVAGGGGGSGDNNGTTLDNRGHAGGLYGYNSKSPSSMGGSQTTGGYSNGGHSSTSGVFGAGGYSGATNYNSGGGGGYYGGAGNGYGGGQGSGGSSFISGMKGCVAINPASTTEPRAQDSMGATFALNYFDTSFGGTSLTWPDGAEILFTSISMVDGEGYEWNTGAKAATSTGMPDWSKTDGSTITGNTTNGYARITRIQ